VACTDLSATFDPDAPWTLDPRVALRPEPFGALAYHYGTRRLSFLKTKPLVEVVMRLETEPSARDAIRETRIEVAEVPAYEQALARLAGTGMIVRRANA
jgi:mycofactocin biosynthesis protein MftB